METKKRVLNDQPFGLGDLPPELIRNILLFVDPKKLQDVRLTSSFLNAITTPLMLQKLVEGSDLKDIVTGVKSTLILLKNGEVFGSGDLACLPDPNKEGFQRIPGPKVCSVCLLGLSGDFDSYRIVFEGLGVGHLQSNRSVVQIPCMDNTAQPITYPTRIIDLSRHQRFIREIFTNDFLENSDNRPLSFSININNHHKVYFRIEANERHGQRDLEIPLDQPVMDVALGRESILLLTGNGDVYLLGQDLDVPDVAEMLTVPKKLDQFDGNARKIAAIDDRYYVVTKGGELFVLGKNYQPPPQIQSDDEQEEEEEQLTPPKYSGFLGLGSEVTEVYGKFQNTGLTRVIDITVNKSITAVRCDNSRLYICGEGLMLERLNLKTDELCVNTFAEVLPVNNGQPIRFAKSGRDCLFVGASTNPFNLFAVSNKVTQVPNPFGFGGMLFLRSSLKENKRLGTNLDPAQQLQSAQFPREKRNYNKRLEQYNQMLQVKCYLETCFDKALAENQSSLWLSDDQIKSSGFRLAFMTVKYGDAELLVPSMISALYERHLKNFTAVNCFMNLDVSQFHTIFKGEILKEINNLRVQLDNPKCENVDSTTEQLEIFEEIAYRGLGMEIENPDTPTAGM